MILSDEIILAVAVFIAIAVAAYQSGAVRVSVRRARRRPRDDQ